MRKSREEAAQTRERIVAEAARAFRQGGIVATGLSDLMSAAGLTHGGFYKHFASKDQLVAEACAVAVDALIARMESAPTAGAAVASYLSAQHRDDPGTGCPLAAIGSELGRTDDRTRQVATDGFERLVAVVMGRSRARSARSRALVTAAAMIGAVTMARVVSDASLSDEILRAVRESLAEG